MAKRDVVHELEEYLYPTLQNVAVGKILCISRSDHITIRGQTDTTVTTIILKKINRWKSWRSDHPWWLSDRPGTKAGSGPTPYGG
jgi:hypothetical protein